VFNASKDEGVDVNVASDEVDSTLMKMKMKRMNKPEK